MKKILLTAGLAIITLASFAQDFWSDRSVETKITFGLMFGTNVNFPKLNSPDMSVDNFDYPSTLSSVFGINTDFRFNDYFSIRPGIAYIGKSFSMEGIDYDNSLQVPVAISDKYQLNYLEFPLDFIGHLPFNNGANIFLGAGPYIAKGMNASIKETTSNNESVKQKLTYGNNGDLKSMDYGITTVMGFQAADGWAGSINFNFGGTNMIPNSSATDGGSLKINTLYFSVGKSF